MQMKLLYKSYFRGWVEITKKQRIKLTKHMIQGITALSGNKKLEYINTRFKEV